MKNNAFDSLTAREVQVVRLVSQGLTDDEIGRKLRISAKTVNQHRGRIYRRTKARNAAHLVRLALEAGVLN